MASFVRERTRAERVITESNIAKHCGCKRARHKLQTDAVKLGSGRVKIVRPQPAPFPFVAGHHVEREGAGAR